MQSHLENIFNNSISLFKNTVILGDFNIDCLKHTAMRSKLLDFMSLHGFNQLISSPTSFTDKSKSLINLIFSNSELVNTSKVSLCDISDHFLITSHVNVAPYKANPSTVIKRNFKNSLLLKSIWTFKYLADKFKKV